MDCRFGGKNASAALELVEKRNLCECLRKGDDRLAGRSSPFGDRTGDSGVVVYCRLTYTRKKTVCSTGSEKKRGEKEEANAAACVTSFCTAGRLAGWLAFRLGFLSSLVALSPADRRRGVRPP